MEPPTERAEMELLESSPPGPFDRLVSGLIARRGVRMVLVAVGALVVGFGVATSDLQDEGPQAPASAAEADSSSTSEPRHYVPPPWVTSARTGWRVRGPLSIDVDQSAHVVTFRAVNLSDHVRKPQDLKAVGRYAGAPGRRFSASCDGFDHGDTGKLRPLRTGAQPGETIVLRCTDSQEPAGRRRALLERTVVIRGLTD